ncbi:hypothetical protein [Rhodoplanes sp. Z2-YC6860]|uniref:hypothetical protein n=1 Tax=Rhodoplanes sp. Z2-YC6860 TaxID=674703 RepID=UPI0012ED5D14|nr:hypothetical protein [Rhodoplanes sp. Z2-YC6860]
MAKKTQIQKFRELARTLESEETEGRFNDTLRRVAQHKPPTPQQTSKHRTTKKTKTPKPRTTTKQS